jgi:SAM-dependent methyltransferase
MYIPELKFDLVICRQALGYLDLHSLARDIPLIMKPTGRFVFNNFRRPKVGIQTYRHANRRYWEASCYLGRRVFHLQAGPGMDVTSFRWHTEARILQVLSETMRLVERKETDRTLWMSFGQRVPIVQALATTWSAPQ